MDANEVLGVVEWALSLTWMLGLLVLWWLLARHLELEERVRRVEGDTSRLSPLAQAIEEAALAPLMARIVEEDVP